MEHLVLDSSVWIAIERGVENEIQVLKEGFNIILPAMVAAELMPDPARIQPGTTRHQRSLDFLAFVRREAEFAAFDEKVVEKYVQLISFCKREGQPRSIPDLMIAATALAHGALLKSFDKKAVFENLPNLRVLS